ncbi:hypothetical protein Pcinc_025968 [Petrolisthes cinctipes]|uniref:Protein OS9-like domain-containing protein n=1 Tax=Petrolisthes cinctipes TaxID=88211 RepID=A0AAE1F9G6_PETCI|nr:hypothetical protein Pcinc_025968 [Petrolisthes cinctipes]
MNVLVIVEGSIHNNDNGGGFNVDDGFNVDGAGFNVDEINNSLDYAVDILNTPVLKDQAWEGEVMSVVNKHGQEYLCFLPNVPSMSESDMKRDDDILDQQVDISELLKPMETAPCLIKTVDWWTYEFCYGGVIMQYHLEGR